MTLKALRFFLLLTILISFQFYYSLSCLAADSSITIAGSTTILPISERWAKIFKQKTGINVNVHGGGSTSGIHAAKAGTADIAASSRELNQKEKVSLKQIVIGRDALVIIVNKSNSINNLSVEQLRNIYSGKIKSWKEVNGPDKPIQLINRESGSGTRALFEELVVNVKDNNNNQMSLKSIVNNSNAEVRETVKLIPGAIGYISYGFADDTVIGLNIENVQPALSNIELNKYKLIRNLYYLVKDDNNQLIKKFLDFVLSKDAQSIVSKEGYIPIPSV